MGFDEQIFFLPIECPTVQIIWVNLVDHDHRELMRSKATKNSEPVLLTFVLFFAIFQWKSWSAK